MMGQATRDAAPGTTPVSESGPAIRIDVESTGWPARQELHRLVADAVAGTWAELRLPVSSADEISLLFTDDERMRALNASWRGIDRATNVLSFPAGPGHRTGAPATLLGDIVLAAETVARESALENRDYNHHLMHLIVHGLLHLLGYDHQADDEANRMEALETCILARFDIPDPYRVSTEDRHR